MPDDAPHHRHAARLAGAVLVAAGVCMGGCGGTIGSQDLQRSVERIGSVAAEGRLLGDDVAHDRARSEFVRAHARELADETDHEAEKLADASAPRDLVLPKAYAGALARLVSSSLIDLQIMPRDEATGRRAAAQLARYATAARRLQAAS